VWRHALTLFVPTQHRVSVAASLEAYKGGFGRAAAAAENGRELVFRNH
jgi:hypothetical protein